MPRVRVNLFATLRSLVGQKTVEVDLPKNATVLDLAQALAERFPVLRPHLFQEDGRLHHSIHILLNGRDFIYTEEKERTPVVGVERIDIFPPVGGGGRKASSIIDFAWARVSS